MTEIAEVKTIGDVERIVLASGMWDGTSPVVFSNDGQAWAEAWEPSDEHPLPTFARVSTYRKDVRYPTTVTIRWDEQVPRADEFWAAKWHGAPMRHFGRTARMVAYRQAFRDLLGDISIEDEAVASEIAAESTPVEAPRDFAVEIAEADTLDVLSEVDKAARKARAFTPDAAGTALHRALKARRRELTAAAGAVENPQEPEAAAPVAPRPVPKPPTVTPVQPSAKPKRRRKPKPAPRDAKSTSVEEAMREALDRAQQGRRK